MSISQAVCSECGKLVTFLWMPIEQYTYKFSYNGIKYYQCSYNCWRKFEKEHKLDEKGGIYAKGTDNKG